ncbi:MAG: glycosyltransferase family 2 protein [Sporocytophaga sp.]|nr:glycosyltransferase family 2 protein [Sporocytophaga sp.]
MNHNKVELSIVMPCLNEAETLATCITKANNFIKEHNINAEVIIADNGSSDGSQEIASKQGARVVNVPVKGYGSALRHGIKAAHGKYIVMGDSDDSYNFYELMPFLHKLREGNDLVMGNRFKGRIEEGAMPFLHKYLGNPVLSFTGRLFFQSAIGDFHCGLRGFSKDAFQRMDLTTGGMEFASEMVVKASLLKMKIAEVPVTLSPDGRSRPPHLRTWRDGWRHLRFLLMYSPNWLFLYPGLLMIILGLILSSVLIFTPITIKGIQLDVHTLLYASSAVVIGFQCTTFYVFSKIFAIREGLLPESKRLNKLFEYVNLEVGLIVGTLILIAGIGLSVYSFLQWDKVNFGSLNPALMLRKVIPAVTCSLLGVQILLYSFFLSILGLKK